MIDKNVIDMKKHLLAHVLYEMEMYLFTYSQLHRFDYYNMSIYSNSQLRLNIYWNAHNVALRNLMSFFGIINNKGKDELFYDSFSFAEQPPNRKKQQTYYTSISKAINHLTIQRFEGYNGRTLDEIVIEARETMFPYIKEYIRLFLKHLEDEKSITYRYENKGLQTIDITSELSDERIKSKLADVKALLVECENITIHLPVSATTS